jgi:hypothetical protein
VKVHTSGSTSLQSQLSAGRDRVEVETVGKIIGQRQIGQERRRPGVGKPSSCRKYDCPGLTEVTLASFSTVMLA